MKFKLTNPVMPRWIKPRKEDQGNRAIARSRRRILPTDPTGLKRWFVPGEEGKGGTLTPYGAKERRRRRSAARVARLTRAGQYQQAAAVRRARQKKARRV